VTTAVPARPPDVRESDARVQPAPPEGRATSDGTWWGARWTDEQGVMAAIARGDVDAYEAFFRTHYTLLCEFACRLVRTPESAEEVVQEVLMDVWSRRDTITVRKSIRAYLYGAVRHTALDTLARAKRQAEHERVMYDCPTTGAALPDAHEQLVRAERSEALSRLIEQLPEKRRTAFELRVGCQLSYAEIADVLETSAKNVEVLIYRATAELRAALPHFMH
jgi:RNA polymerase sigma-70 factor (family 1)